jgi:Fe-Mn family superoxide dismutase
MAEHELPPLPYDYGALEPHIDTQTMQIHHDKHHATYVNNLNAALKEQPDLQGKSPEQLMKDIDSVPESIRTAVRNNGGGHVNHTLFWDIMTPGGRGEPSGELATAIQTAFGGVEPLKAAINDAGAKRFGSGWAWLVVEPSGSLSVISTPNQDSPLMEGNTPILGVDVWEHAYYLKYQNRRPDYLQAWWNTVNWDKVAERYAQATGQ